MVGNNETADEKDSGCFMMTCRITSINRCITTKATINLLMTDNKKSFDRQCCAYGEGYTGTLRMRSAMAKHLNNHFKPAMAIDAEEITFAAGVTSLNEVCALVLCNPDDAINYAPSACIWCLLSRF